MLKLNDANNFRRTVAGLCLIVAPLVLGIGEVIRLAIQGSSAGGSEEHLATVAANLGLWQTMTIINMISVILFVPAVLGILHLLRRRGAVLGHVGGALALVGLLGAAGHNVFANVLDGAMASLEGARPQMIQLAQQIEGTSSFLFVLLMFIVGFVLGNILLAIGIYRARVAPRWAAALFGLAMLVSANAGSSLGLTIIAMLLLIAGMGTIGLKVLTMTDTDWERVRMSASAEEKITDGSSTTSTVK